MNQWLKGIASWKVGGTLYLSVPFTWLLDDARRLARSHKGRVVAGGPAVDLCRDTIDWAETPPTCPYDTLAMHNPLATFTTRGCPNRCRFCAVPRIEGEFRELPTWRPAPVVCDNNLLAASRRHVERVVDSLLVFEHVDFNQGLDARLFTAWHAGQLARLKSCKVRFALDAVGAADTVANAIAIARKAGLEDFGCYVLVGFNDTPTDAVERLELVRMWGVRPNPMRYQPLDAQEKNAYVAPGWTDYDLQRTCRYYSRLRWLEHIPFADYHCGENDSPLFPGHAPERSI